MRVHRWKAHSTEQPRGMGKMALGWCGGVHQIGGITFGHDVPVQMNCSSAARIFTVPLRLAFSTVHLIFRKGTPMKPPAVPPAAFVLPGLLPSAMASADPLKKVAESALAMALAS